MREFQWLSLGLVHPGGGHGFSQRMGGESGGWSALRVGEMVTWHLEDVGKGDEEAEVLRWGPVPVPLCGKGLVGRWEGGQGLDRGLWCLRVQPATIQQGTEEKARPHSVICRGRGSGNVNSHSPACGHLPDPEPCPSLPPCKACHLGPC